MKILIVDDKKENLYLLERMIKKLGYEPVMAENGKQALEKLHSDNFIMVISDILMPVMDGYQLCKAVRNNKKLNDILFIFYTATYKEKEDEEFALDLGADKFLRKPIEPEKFIEVIKNLIQNMEISQVKPRKTIIKEEKEILKLYNERLIHKLEKKILDLEKKTEMEIKSVKKYREEFYKDLFTHDIKNILQSIFSGIELNELYLQNPENFNNLNENMKTIKKQVLRGAKLVSNVNSLSHLEESDHPFRKIDLIPLLKTTINLIKNTYIDNDIIIQVDPIDKALYVQADDFLVDVFENIIYNSIEHNDNTVIEINVKISKQERINVAYIKLEFLDNGIGIEDNQKLKIFEKGSNKEDNVPGRGLGLSLVKNIIEIYSGDIWIEDRVKNDYSKGNNFIILIPEAL